MRALMLMLLGSAACWAAEGPHDFAFGVAVQTSGSEPLYAVELPHSVYQGAVQPGLADLRVFNAAGEPVPFAFEPRSPAQIDKAEPVALNYFPLYGKSSRDLEGLNLRVERGHSGTVVSVIDGQHKRAAKRTLRAYLVDASSLRQPYQALELDWTQSADSVATNLHVESSNDLQHWSTVVSQAPLVRADFGGHRLEQRSVEFSPHTAKYLRLSWPALASTEQALELTKVSVRTADVAVEPQRSWREFAGTPGDKPGEYLFDLGGQFPVDRVRIGLPQENTIAGIELLTRPSSKRAWNRMAATTAYRLSKQGQQVSSPDISVSTIADRFWLLRVDQTGGGLGSGLPRLTIGWLPRKLIFAARGAGPFQIAYGSPTAQSTALAVESVVPGWRSDAQLNFAQAQALPERLLGGADALQPRRNYKVHILWATLVLGVGLLGWMTWKLVKQMQASSQSS